MKSIILEFLRNCYEGRITEASALADTQKFRFYLLDWSGFLDVINRQRRDYASLLSVGEWSAHEIEAGLVSVFKNGVLIAEEDFRLENNRVIGTAGSVDAFGKIVWNNRKPQRVVSFRLPRGSSLISFDMQISGSQVAAVVDAGATFAEDGFAVAKLLPAEDPCLDLATKVGHIRIVATGGVISDQRVVLRGTDYPFFHMPRPRFRLDQNGELARVSLGDCPQLHSLVVELRDGTKRSIPFPDPTDYQFHTGLKRVELFVAGVAHNLYFDL